MLISGSGFTAFNVKIKPDFIPDTKLALNWYQLANNDYACTDRGHLQDKYNANIRIYGKEDLINNFITQMELNRNSATNANVITLSNFNSQEKIFGADVIYTSDITATAFIERRTQNTWKGFGLGLSMACINPVFIPTPSALPELKYLDVGIDADSDRTINKIESYNRLYYYQEHGDDSGLFTGVFTLRQDEMAQLRRFIATLRGGYCIMPTISGVNKPFGRRNAIGKNARIIDFEDMGMYSMECGQPRWQAKVTFAEAFV